MHAPGLKAQEGKSRRARWILGVRPANSEGMISETCKMESIFVARVGASRSTESLL